MNPEPHTDSNTTPSTDGITAPSDSAPAPSSTQASSPTPPPSLESEAPVTTPSPSAVVSPASMSQSSPASTSPGGTPSSFMDTATPVSQPDHSAAAAGSSPLAPKKSGPPRSIIAVAILALLIPLVGALGYLVSDAKTKEANKKVAALESQLQKATVTYHELPADAVKITDCIPNMGAHYLPKESDPIYGPWLLVNTAGKVIGIEYMADPSMYTPIPNTNPPIEILEKDSPMYGWTYDHAEFIRAPEGHEGDLVDHIDVHLYTVPKSVQAEACK